MAMQKEFESSQIATAEENNFTVAIYGTKGHLKWAQENPNYLYYGLENTPLQVLKPGHEFNSDAATQSTKPPGHPEGIFDAMGNIYHGVADAIANNPRELLPGFDGRCARHAVY